MSTILVTGATGTVGSALVPLLRARGANVLALVRDPSRAESILGDGVQFKVGDFADRASLRAAMKGVDSVFLACGNIADQVAYECAVIDEAARPGYARSEAVGPRRSRRRAGRLLALARPDRTPPEGGTTSRRSAPAKLLDGQPARRRGSCPPARHALRPGRPRPHLHDRPCRRRRGRGRRVDHYGPRRPDVPLLTGPEAINYARVAADLTAATGHSVGYANIPPEAADPALVDAGMPPFAAEQIVAVFAALRKGAQGEITDTVHTVTGRAARSFANFARDHSSTFRASGVTFGA